MINLGTLRAMVGGKRVLLVGNSTELMNYDNAELIDSYDIVVRFGRGIDYGPKQAKAIGTKLDIWVTGAFRADMLYQQKFREMLKGKTILVNRSRVHVNKPVKINKNVLNYPWMNMYEDQQILRIMEAHGIKDSDRWGSRFSAGLWAIKFFIEMVKVQDSLTIIGFDFFAKKTNKMRGGDYEPSSWHLPISVGKEETHSHDQEVAIVREYQKQGLLTWIVLSDLEPAWINDSKYGEF